MSQLMAIIMDMSMHWRVASKAFRRGFRDGFGAPTIFFRAMATRRSDEIRTDVDSAWKAVDKAMRDALELEHSSLAKRAEKKSSKQRNAA